MKNNAELLRRIRAVVTPATGCTEPVAIALNAATARDHLKGEMKACHVKMDICLLKNASGVGIPGVSERGVSMCVATGIAGGDASRGMDVLGKITEEAHQRALKIEPLIDVQMDETRKGLFIETIMESDSDSVRVITEGGHDRIVSIEHAPFSPYVSEDAHDNFIEEYELKDFFEFANTVDVKELDFLKEGVAMNTAVADAGRKLKWGECLGKLQEKHYLDNSLILKAQQETSCASYARMSGVSLPVMTTTGSGNQGITLILTTAVVAKELGVPEEQMLRGIAFAQAINLYAKHFLGTLSAMCACGVASGLGAASGIVYMLGGSEKQVIDCMRNILGSITGMICDGAKEGCANKVCIASGVAVMSALMAMEGLGVSCDNGILASDLRGLFENIGAVANVGMNNTNAAVVDIMLHK